jgi:hypothetical protein
MIFYDILRKDALGKHVQAFLERGPDRSIDLPDPSREFFSPREKYGYCQGVKETVTTEYEPRSKLLFTSNASSS